MSLKLFNWLMKRVTILLVFIQLSCSSQSDFENQSEISLPPGFKIEIFASDVDGARSMALSENGLLFVGTRNTGKVFAIKDTNQDFKADEIIVIADDMNLPNGVAVKDGDLYVAEINRVLRFDDIEKNLYQPGNPVIVNDKFPSDRHHGWKFIAFGPDDKLYVPVGAPCNVCMREDERYASIMRMNKDGSELEIYAHGVRNSVGFDWDPETGDLWFTDNGRDLLGDDLPPDELNHATAKGQHFGFPFIHGKNIPDPEFGINADTSQFIEPAIELGPHVAALGMRFYTGDMFPAEYKNQIFIAEHGSWNRSEKIGYRITLVRLENGKAVSYEVFAEGWLKGDSVSGRPVDILILPDGSMLVSDDFGGVIYRISYSDN
ncbi:MAG: sorbosone dehydrogenase family protein [Ignavibacteriaceae bacterium]